MAAISIRELLEMGVHFGHQTKRWNPKMKRYIFGQRSGIYIIDLLQTLECLKKATSFLADLSSKGQSVLFVGTKRQAREIVETEAKRSGAFYMNNRWLGGTLTNFQTIQKSIKRLKELKQMEEGAFDLLPKKEVLKLKKERDSLGRNLSGIEEMKKLPGALFIIDAKKEKIAIAEARKLEIPIVALVDTNCDPDEIDFCIPGNDDAIKAVKVITGQIADAILKGKTALKDSRDKAAASEAKETLPVEEASTAEIPPADETTSRQAGREVK